MTLLESGIDSHSVHLVIRIVYALWHGTRFLVSLLVVTERLLNPHHDLIPPIQSAFIVVNAREWSPFSPRVAPGDREAGSQTWGAALEMDMKPRIDQRMRPRARLARRSFRPRYSRIPDRLCRPNEENGWF